MSTDALRSVLIGARSVAHSGMGLISYIRREFALRDRRRYIYILT